MNRKPRDKDIRVNAMRETALKLATSLSTPEIDPCDNLRQRIREIIAKGQEMMENHTEGNAFSVIGIHTRIITMLERELDKEDKK